MLSRVEEASPLEEEPLPPNPKLWGISRRNMAALQRQENVSSHITWVAFWAGDCNSLTSWKATDELTGNWENIFGRGGDLRMGIEQEASGINSAPVLNNLERCVGYSEVNLNFGVQNLDL